MRTIHYENKQFHFSAFLGATGVLDVEPCVVLAWVDVTRTVGAKTSKEPHYPVSSLFINAMRVGRCMHQSLGQINQALRRLLLIELTIHAITLLLFLTQA